jgi:hypothetical protein
MCQILCLVLRQVAFRSQSFLCARLVRKMGMQVLTNNIATRELITRALKFENNCHFSVTAAKENK